MNGRLQHRIGAALAVTAATALLLCACRSTRAGHQTKTHAHSHMHKHRHKHAHRAIGKYIALLERKDRAAWQKPDAVVAALGLSGAETVVDVGAGSGYFAFRLAKSVPRGKVIALDVEPKMVHHMAQRIRKTAVSNVEARVTKPDDPEVPRSADLVFVCNVLHHAKNKATWLGRLYSRMKRGARLVVIEFRKGPLPLGPPEWMKLSRQQVISLVTQAGFVGAAGKPKLLPYQTIFFFHKP